MAKKSVLITGGGIGIGRATALTFAREGYAVMVTDVLDKEGNEVARSITEQGGTAEYFHLDVTDTAAANDLVAAIEKRHGALDTVVANAGIFSMSPLLELEPQMWHAMLAVNLTGVWHTLKAAVPHVRSGGRGGSVILISSGAALMPPRSCRF